MKLKAGLSSLSLSRIRHNYPKVLFLIIPILIGLIASVFVITDSTNNQAEAAVQYSDSDLVNWRYDNYPLMDMKTVAPNKTFGNVVYDPVSSLYRFFYHDSVESGTGTIRQKTSSNSRVFGNDALVLGHGGVGAWDEEQTGVPYVWYETGETRPWRMIYRGCPVAGNCQIGLATSLDGVTWERKDTGGNALAVSVLAGTAGQWDSGSIDFGAITKVGSTYYIYYNTITIASRKTGLATSTDLVTWTKHASNPFYTGVTDYDDKNHNGTVDLTAGFFCGDMVYWPRADGTDRYVMIIPHYVSGSTTPSLDVYTSDTPVFTKSNRTYIGQAFETASGTHYIQGYQINGSGTDTPRIITDDITRNVATSTITGNDVLMVTAVKSSSTGWNQAMLIHHKTLNGAVLSNVNADLPVTNPAFQLAPTGDANTKGLWLPGYTGTLRDLAGGSYHLSGSYSNSIDANGVPLTAANSQWLAYRMPSGTISSLNSITGDFTVETRVSFHSNFTSSYRGILALGTTGAYHFYMYIGGAAGPTYNLYFAVSNGGSTKNAIQALGPITLDQMYRIAVTRTGGKIYFFKDGTLLNAGGTAYAWTIDDTPNAQLKFGCSDSGGSYFWDGYIDEIRISDTARWTSNYTPAALTYGHETSGSIFTKVYDFGATNTDQSESNPTVTTPAGTAVGEKVRSASSSSDQSSTIGDFLNIPQPTIRGQYQQHALTLTTSDVTQTPTVTSVDVDNVTLPRLSQITAVPSPTNNTTPSYTFNTDKAGTITYGGDCSSSTTTAVVGNNTVKFNALSEGTHSNCTIIVTNNSYPSDPLSVNTFTIDTTPPNISGPTVIFNDNSATVSWTTDEASTSRVDYGFTDNYNSMTEDTNMVTEHHVGLSDLMPCHEYHYRVYSKDSSGNDRFSTDNIFTTEGCPAPLDTGSWRYFSGAYATSSSLGTSSTSSTSQGIPFSGTMDSSIRFDATNLFPGKSITKYIWDFGDGKTDEGRIVNHKYSSPNRYTVKVTGYDKDGNEYVFEQTIDINPEVPTIKNITSTNDTDLIIEGNGYKGDTIYLTIHSTPMELTSSVDDTGYWSYTITNASETLGEGDHSVTAIDSFKLADNSELKSSPTDDTKFSVTVDNGKLKVEMEKTSRWKTIACVLGGIIVLGAIVYLVRRRTHNS